MPAYGEPLRWSFGGRRIAVRTLVIVTIAAFLLQIAVDNFERWQFTRLFSLSWPKLVQGQLWRLATYMFVHRNFWHIFMNMFSLAIFGREIEEHFGTRRLLLLYFGCGILAGLGWVLIHGPEPGSCIGASGAVFGVLGAFAAAFPDRQVTLLLFFVLPVTMTARTMAILLGGMTLALLYTGDGEIAHAAHLAGGIIGYVVGRHWAQALSADGRPDGPFGGSPADGEYAPDAPRARWRLFAGRDEPLNPDEVDRILEKITQRGMGSLTRREREILDRASRGEGRRSCQ